MIDGRELPPVPGAAANRSLPLRKRFAIAVASAMGISVIGQALAFFRQILVAAYFGVSRDIDIYLIAYLVAGMVVFTFGSIFDSVAVPRLVQIHERHGEKPARALAVAVFRVSWLIAVAASVVMLLAVKLLGPVIATGFNPAERTALFDLTWYFLPWTVLYVPYYAAAARHKATRNFNRVFAAEIAIGIVSIACLAAYHADIEFLPLAYATGYGAGLLMLLPCPGFFQRTGVAQSLQKVLCNIGELFLVNQTGNLQSVADRHFQSLVPAGGIAAVGYATQLVNGLSTLLLFREIFVVPLSATERRAEKLQHLITGLMLLALPAATFVACFAPEVIQILYKRGQFDAAAASLTAEVLRIYVLSLIPGLVLTPLFRMFQIIDRIGLANAVYLVSSAFVVGLGYLLVQRLGLGAPGVALMLLCNSILSLAVTAILVGRAGVVLDWWRLLKYAGFAAGVSIAAGVLALGAASPFAGAAPRIFLGGTVFAAVVFGAYFLIRAHLRRIIYS